MFALVDPAAPGPITSLPNFFQAENDLLKDKIENLRRGLAYTEDALTVRVNDLSRQLTEARVRIADLESAKKSLETENKSLSKQVEKANRSMKEMMPIKEYEEAVAHYR